MSPIASHSPLNISETVRDRGLHGSKGSPIGNGPYGESNGHVTHVTDDATWPRKVKLVTPTCLERNISKTAGDAI